MPQNNYLGLYDLHCQNCGVLKSPPTLKEVTYFDLMKQSVNFNVDIKNLSKKHRELQTKLHQDKYSTKSDEEKENSEN